MHFSAQLINSFPLLYGLWSWAKEEFSIPLEAHHRALSSEIFPSFQAKKEKSCNFVIFWPILLKLHILASETDSSLTPYDLSNSGEEKLQFTPF